MEHSLYSDIVPVKYGSSVKDYSLFPNPATDAAFLITGAENVSEINIINTEGKKIKSFYFDGSSQINELNLSDLTKGIYNIEVRSEFDTRFLRLVKL